MMTTRNCSSMLTTKAQEYLQQTTQPVPKYPCKTCKKQSNGRCNCFNRPVDEKINRCFNHSAYNPIPANFKAPDNIEQIALENEEKLYA